MILVKHIKGVHEIYLIYRDSFFITKIYLNIKGVYRGYGIYESGKKNQ